jgi:hypothetical protein
MVDNIANIYLNNILALRSIKSSFTNPYQIGKIGKERNDETLPDQFWS